VTNVRAFCYMTSGLAQAVTHVVRVINMADAMAGRLPRRSRSATYPNRGGCD